MTSSLISLSHSGHDAGMGQVSKYALTQFTLRFMRGQNIRKTPRVRLLLDKEAAPTASTTYTLFHLYVNPLNFKYQQ